MPSFVVALRLTIQQKEFAMSLVITRKSGQSFSVGDATITLQIENGQIKVIIDAPREMSVVRSELTENNSKQ
jgi:carbon storage regulator CsrA